MNGLTVARAALPCAVLLCCCALADARQPVSLRELRYDRVVGQTDWATCGPAALSTMFTFYLGRPVSEAELTGVGVEYMRTRGQDWRDGLSLGALRTASRAFGVPADGFEMTFGHLRDHVSGGVPVLVNLTRPTPHFALVVAVIGNEILLADPSRGQRMESVGRFLDSWNGVVLTFTPDAPSAGAAREAASRDVARLLARRAQLRSSR